MPSEIGKYDNKNHTEIITKSLQGEASVEPTINPTDNTQQNHLKIPESSYSEIFNGQVQNPSAELQQQVSEGFSSEQTQAKNELLALKHQRSIEAANHLLPKQELERNQLIQHPKQLFSEIQHDNVPS